MKEAASRLQIRFCMKMLTDGYLHAAYTISSPMSLPLRCAKSKIFELDRNVYRLLNLYCVIFDEGCISTISNVL